MGRIYLVDGSVPAVERYGVCDTLGMGVLHNYRTAMGRNASRPPTKAIADDETHRFQMLPMRVLQQRESH